MSRVGLRNAKTYMEGKEIHALALLVKKNKSKMLHKICPQTFPFRNTHPARWGNTS